MTACVLLWASAFSVPAPRAAEHCSGFDPGRKIVLFGDLHVHTNMSFDAYFFNSLNGPREAYRFAKGEPIGLPCDAPHVACRTARLEVPLDFTAVTDHSEFLGAFRHQCSEIEGRVRGFVCDELGQYVRNNVRRLISGNTPFKPSTIAGLSMLDPEPGWELEKRIADEENAPCSFTAFAAYEYSAQPAGAMMHRNIVFLGDRLPKRAWSFNDVPDEWALFDRLDADCPGDARCDYVSIPHNSNLSDGRMFPPAGAGGTLSGRGGAPLTRSDAENRGRHDRLVEIFQHKGQSECMPGFGFDLLGSEEEKDELCAFERMKPICRDGVDDPALCLPAPEQICQTPSQGEARAEPDNCTAPWDMARVALGAGLQGRKTLGVNPYKLGFAGATDTHNGLAGGVAEATFRGHGGVLDNRPADLLGSWTCLDGAAECDERERRFSPNAFPLNPGGLTGVWAEENTRAAIFAAFKRRETFATSGPRMRARLYAAWTPFASDVCRRLEGGGAAAELGAENPVPMGGELAPLPTGDARSAIHLVLWAARAPETANDPGAPLARLQVIKTWITAEGTPKSRVIDVAGAASASKPDGACRVDQHTGAAQLCATWADSELSETSDVMYYLRAVEVPTCRWSTHLCVSKAVDCSLLDPKTGAFAAESGFAGYEGCCHLSPAEGGWRGTNRFDVIRERAVTSPIWFAAPVR
ncbi:MAG: DUF3604 domain-containing protein [Candidatus Schekmanbacteria bacterium]|nr:DUF3604 domain-containing protein [Candidatus Schekmanbacteria bacterium]